MGLLRKEVDEFEPRLPALSDEPSDDDRSPATPSREELSVFNPKFSFPTSYDDRSEETPSGEEVSDPESDDRSEEMPSGEELSDPKSDDRSPATASREGLFLFDTFAVSEDDRSQETRSRAGLVQFEPSTHYERTDVVYGALVDVVEERRKAMDEGVKAVVEREQIDPNVFFGETSVGGLKMPFSKTKTGLGLQHLAEVTTIATGPGTKHDWIDSLLPRVSVREVLSRRFRQSSPTGARRWSFKSPLSAFGLGECLLEGGKTRVRWRCVCGRKMYDDFIELRPGAAAEFEKWLNHSIRNHAVARASNPSQDGTMRSSTSSRAGVSGQQQTAESDISLQPLSWTASTMPESDKNAPVTIDVHLEKCWLLICGQPRRGPDSLLAQLDLSSKPSDKDLFDSMKQFHSSLRSTLTLRPVLKGVQTIRFVQASFEN